MRASCAGSKVGGEKFAWALNPTQYVPPGSMQPRPKRHCKNNAAHYCVWLLDEFKDVVWQDTPSLLISVFGHVFFTFVHNGIEEEVFCESRIKNSTDPVDKRLYNDMIGRTGIVDNFNVSLTASCIRKKDSKKESVGFIYTI